MHLRGGVCRSLRTAGVDARMGDEGYLPDGRRGGWGSGITPPPQKKSIPKGRGFDGSMKVQRVSDCGRKVHMSRKKVQRLAGKKMWIKMRRCKHASEKRNRKKICTPPSECLTSVIDGRTPMSGLPKSGFGRGAKKSG